MIYVSANFSHCEEETSVTFGAQCNDRELFPYWEGMMQLRLIFNRRVPLFIKCVCTIYRGALLVTRMTTAPVIDMYMDA
jgi:hypothetical protein